MHVTKKTLDAILYWITVVLFAALVLVVVWQVFSRQVLSTPATWTDEGARMLFVWLGLFSSALVFGERGHVAVEIIARKFPGKSERVLSVIVQCLILAFAVIVLVYGGWRAASNAWHQELGALPFTLGQMYIALPVSGILMAFYSIYYIIGITANLEEPYGDNSDEEVVVAESETIADQARATSLLLGDDPDQASAPQSDERKGTN